MHTVAVILVRAGSKGLPDKCVLPLLGRPVLAYTLDHVRASQRVEVGILSTDSPRAAEIGREAGCFLVERPPYLAADTATSQDAARHAIEEYEARTRQRADVVVVLGGNVPVRQEGIIDRCIARLVETGCDSVQTVAPVGKYHPDWMYRLHDGRMSQYRQNNIVRRQDLEPLYGLDGGVLVVRRAGLLSPATATNPTAYLGEDRQAVVQEEECVDIDTRADFYRAEAVLRMRAESAAAPPRPQSTSQTLITAGS